MSLKTKWRESSESVKAYLLWAIALVYLLLSTTLYSYVKDFFDARPPLWVILASMCLIFYPPLRLIRLGAIYYWKRATDHSTHPPVIPQVCNVVMTPAEHRLYRVLLMVRIGSAIALLMFLGLALYGKIISRIADSNMVVLILTITFFVFLDALISYMFPRLAAQIPANALLAYIFRASLFSKSGEKKSYILSIMILTVVIFIVLLM